MAKVNQSNRSKRASTRRAFHDIRKVLKKQIDGALTACVMIADEKERQAIMNKTLEHQRMAMDTEKASIELDGFYQFDMIGPVTAEDVAEIHNLYKTGLYDVYELASFYDIGFGEVFEIIN
jgi:hypothetical protein